VPIIIFLFFLIASCTKNNFLLNGKGFLGQDIISRLKVSDNCLCQGKGICVTCREDKEKIIEWIDENEPKERCLINFKDESGRNKLSVLATDLVRGVDFKEHIVSYCMNRLYLSLNGSSEHNLSKMKIFDSKDFSCKRVVCYLLSSGMVSLLSGFIDEISKKVDYKYDFGMKEPFSEEEGVSSFCLLAERVRDKENISLILDKIMNGFPSLASSCLDGRGNTIYHLCSIYDNENLFYYFKERNEFRKGLMRVINQSSLSPLHLAIKCFSNSTFRSMLEVELEDKPGGFASSSKMEEYGRELLLISAISCNDDAMDMLFSWNANPGGATYKRIKECFKKAGQVLLDVVANIGDASSYFASGVLFGVTYKGNLLSTALGSYRTYFVANKPILLDEGKISQALVYIEKHYHVRVNSYYEDLKAKAEGMQKEFRNLERKVPKKKSDPLNARFVLLSNETKTNYQKAILLLCGFGGNAEDVDKVNTLVRIMNNYIELKSVRAKVIESIEKLKELSTDIDNSLRQRTNN